MNLAETLFNQSWNGRKPQERKVDVNNDQTINAAHKIDGDVVPGEGSA